MLKKPFQFLKLLSLSLSGSDGRVVGGYVFVKKIKAVTSL
jgi:hypothetical protein